MDFQNKKAIAEDKDEHKLKVSSKRDDRKTLSFISSSAISKTDD